MVASYIPEGYIPYRPKSAPSSGLEFCRVKCEKDRTDARALLAVSRARPLAGPLWLNSEKQADLLIEKKSLPEKPHENQILAEAGYKMYFYSEKVTLKNTGCKDEAIVEASAELKAEEAKAVRAAIFATASEGSQKRAAPKAAAEVSPAEKTEDREPCSQPGSSEAQGYHRQG